MGLLEPEECCRRGFRKQRRTEDPHSPPMTAVRHTWLGALENPKLLKTEQKPEQQYDTQDLIILVLSRKHLRAPLPAWPVHSTGLRASQGGRCDVPLGGSGLICRPVSCK